MTNNENIIAQGWECPKCGRVYSPTTDMCRYCGNEEITVTTGCIPTMRELTPEEREEYNKYLDERYEPTGLNIFDLAEKNNFNRIKRFNKEELASFIIEVTNEKTPCKFCSHYIGEKIIECNCEECLKGVKQWLESEVEKNE